MITIARRRATSRTLRLAAALATATVVLVAGAGTAAAHPLGNFTINHYSGLTIAPDGVAVDFVVDMAEIPTFQEQAPTGTPQQTERYAQDRCRRYADGITVQSGDTAVPLEVLAATASFPAGQGGLPTTRLECSLRSGEGVRIGGGPFRFDNGNDADHIGWREITVVGLGVEVRSDAPAASISDRLRAYPDRRLGDVPRARSIEASLRVEDPSLRLDEGSADALAEPADSWRARAADPLTALVGRADEGAWAMAVAVAVAMGLGALHGLAPGHGKTVVAAYLVGARGTRRQAAGLAAVVALSHTSGVFLLGGLTLVASVAFPIERVYAWLQLGSAVIVVGLGVWLAREALRSRRRPSREPVAAASVASVASVAPRPDALAQARSGAASLVSVGVAGLAPVASMTERAASSVAVLPRTTSRHADHPDHDHPHHPHPHPHHGHDHHGHGHAHHEHHGHPHHGHGHDHGGGIHRHGLLPHRHRVAWDRIDVTQPLRWKVLVPLGLSGGILPSASAVIVLLGAVQIGRIGFGAALIVAFGIGMALALVGVGLGVVALSRHAAHRLAARRWGAWLRRWTTPIAATTLLLVGLWLTTRALVVL